MFISIVRLSSFLASNLIINKMHIQFVKNVHARAVWVDHKQWSQIEKQFRFQLSSLVFLAAFNLFA